MYYKEQAYRPVYPPTVKGWENRMNFDQMVSAMTLEEKALLLTGAGEMETARLAQYGIPEKKLADGPHGVRHPREENCTHFPNLCCLGATWDKRLARKMGNGIAKDCVEHDVDMILGPGINIKKNILCGRNFEYLSEDPILAGELAAEYISGVEEMGIATSLKHFAANNQEQFRQDVSVEVDERTLREIYLKGFEIAVKKAKPTSVMCAYNKVNAIWCSENPFLLKQVLKEEWGFDGFVISDWGAVQDICKAVRAGLDFQMPHNGNIVAELKRGLETKEISMEDIDHAVANVLKFLMRPKPQKAEYSRAEQHETAQEIAAAGTVLLKNEGQTLPLTEDKYRSIAVIGEYAVHPLTSGQGSAEVLQSEAYTDNPLEELRKRLPNTEIRYLEKYKKGSYSPNMLWPTCGELTDFIKDSDVVLFFAGSMESEDTEFFDRRSAHLNPNFEMFIETACYTGKKVVVVLQNGSAILPGKWNDMASAVVEMWLAGEGAGGVCDVLCGNVNPSGRLPETFPKVMRRDLEYPGNGRTVSYNEKLDVGYRYYDRHPEEIAYPFGHGLSYTNFEYSHIAATVETAHIHIEFSLENTGEWDGNEVIQVYVSDCLSTVPRPVKELKYFEKVFLRKDETKKVCIDLPLESLSYYNIMLHNWVVEDGNYDILIGASSRDIRLKTTIHIQGRTPYSLLRSGEHQIG